MEFDHVGVATDDAAESAALFADLLDAPVAHEETRDGLRLVFCRLGGVDDPAPGHIELLEPIAGAEGPVARFLDREGPGIHHLAVRTSDVAAALETARSMGVETVDDTPREGAWGHRVAFLHPRSTGGVLVEFVERTDDYADDGSDGTVAGARETRGGDGRSDGTGGS
jgi:methylmalonyl-CoA/ethylmalonyl-CoA epimerase